MKACPCYSGKPYKDCCQPRHLKTKPAETPEALMRSRYAAFALGLGDYLVDTLSADHDDRAAPRATLVRDLSRAKDTQRFMGLEILEAKTDGDRGEVTFHAKIFQKGADRSFTEHSHFVRENGEWRYAFGEAKE